MSSPINRKLGGLTGEMARMGVTITPGNTPEETEFDFDAPLTLGDKGIPRVHQVALAVVDTAGGVAAFQNPLDVPILVLRAVLEWTTNSTGACTIDVGVAANGTTSSDTLIDGQSVASAAGIVSSTVPRRVAENGGAADWVTASVATGASAGLVGRLYVQYVPIQ